MKKILNAVAFTLLVNLLNAQIPTKGLVAYYSFNGNANDQSGNGYNGTVTGATLTTDRFGKANCAYKFNGVNNYITTLHKKPIGSATLTISFWGKTSSTQVMNPISFSDTANTSVFTISYNNPCAGVGVDGSNGLVMKGNSSLLNNAWHHCVITLGGTVNGVIYIDGVLQSSITCSYNPTQTINPKIMCPWAIGANENHSVRFFNGDLDDIAVYNRAMDSTEVQSLYHEGGYATITKLQDGLVAWYPFTGNALDSSGNGHHGTINGVVLTTDRFGKAKSAFSFSGNKTIIVPNDTSLNVHPNYTIALWYLTNADTYPAQDIFIKGTNDYTNNVFYLRHHASKFSTPVLRFVQTQEIPTYKPGIGVETPDPSMNTWHFVVMNFNNSFCRFYLDNRLVDSANIFLLNNNLINTENLSIGGGYYSFSGKIDDIRVYNRPLNSSEISTLYHDGGYSLPVSIENINAVVNTNLINLNWRTATEINTSHFIIQHSTDGSSFTDIGTVKAIGNGANSYSSKDNNPTPGINYYRLKSVDKDGSFAFSKIVSVQFTVNRLPFTVVPNPARDIVSVKGCHIATIQVIDNLGRVLKTQTLKDATNPTLSVGGLQAGIYHLRVKTTDGKVSGVGFVKE